jgi:hypothetical protein
MNTRFKVFASYNILQYLCDFIHVLIFVTVSKCRRSLKLTNIVIIGMDLIYLMLCRTSISIFGIIPTANMMYTRLQKYTSMVVGEHGIQTFKVVVGMLLCMLFSFDVLSPPLHIPYYIWAIDLSIYT